MAPLLPADRSAKRFFMSRPISAKKSEGEAEAKPEAMWLPTAQNAAATKMLISRLRKRKPGKFFRYGLASGSAAATSMKNLASPAGQISAYQSMIPARTAQNRCRQNSQ